MNLDILALNIHFVWVDARYEHWGSPTCPEEPHCHLNDGRHWVNYDLT